MIGHVGLGVLVGLGLAFATRVCIYRTRWALAMHREAHATMAHLGAGALAFLALAPAVVEEIAFRGAALPLYGLLASSALFAVVHLGPRARHAPWAVLAFGAGLAFAHLAQRTGGLAAPIAAHATMNLLNLRHIARYSI
ncbi:MAG TPA: CPBP family intramembrane glutamic endopeptidase [Candidatus Dormibacteraeota bacterium]